MFAQSVLCAMCCWGCVAAMQPAKPAATPENQYKDTPEDVPGLLAAKNFLETRMYFETLMDGRPVGYQVSSLKPVQAENGATGGADVVYEYRADSILTRDNGMRVDTVTVASLKRTFEPISITIDRQLSHPAANTRHIQDSLRPGAGEFVISHEDTLAATQTPPRSVRRPNEPFVYGMEFIIEAIDVRKNSTLPIPEVDPQEGTISTYRMVPGRMQGDVQEMVLQKDDGGVGYHFRIGPDGRIESWADRASTIMMKRCTQERYQEVRRTIEGK